MVVVFGLCVGVVIEVVGVDLEVVYVVGKLCCVGGEFVEYVDCGCLGYVL